MIKTGFLKKLLLIIIPSLILTISCSSLKILNSSKIYFKNPQEILNLYTGNSSEFKTFAADGMISIVSPELRGHYQLNVRIKYPDSLKVIIEGPMGLDGVSLLICNSEYTLYLNREDVVYYGDLDTLNYSSLLDKYTGIMIDEGSVLLEDVKDEIFGFFRGCYNIDPAEMRAVNFEDSTKSENIFEHTEASGLLLKYPLYSADLREISINDDNDTEAVNIKFERYVKSGKVRFPRRIKYTFPQDRSRMSIVYRNFRINNKIPPEEFILNIPEELLKKNKKNK
ncbi:MAG: DUF4292 domain-containing protein [bacterium]|nr:DUF4292 domain-containing protein [bacterium]